MAYRGISFSSAGVALCACLLLLAALGGCGGSETHAPGPGPFDGLSFGEDGTFEVVTWNIQNFPKKTGTVGYVGQIIEAVDADIYAIQEIDNVASFGTLVANLDGWSGHHTGDDYLSLGYIWRTDRVTVTAGPYEILQSEWYGLPRDPLVLELTVAGEPLVIIDNHLKAMGDAESVDRRREGCELLEAWIDTNFPDTAVILLGDLNDELLDGPADNVFRNFLDRPADFAFTDLTIASVDRQHDWSYPSWPSHLDHILVTNELFGVWANGGSEVRTLRVDDYLSSYASNVSDHRPVALKLDFTPATP